MKNCSLNWEAANLPEAYELFKQKCEIFFAIKNIAADKQVPYILFMCGDEGLRRFNSWKLSEDDKKDPSKVWGRFEQEIVKPGENWRVARLKLQALKQKQDEPFDQFVTRVKLQAYKCSFKDTAGESELESRVIEQLIAGTKHPDVQKELLQKDASLTLEASLTYGRTFEASLAHLKDLADLQGPATPVEVSAVKSTGSRKCLRCGQPGVHAKGEECPAAKSTCKYCDKVGHWERVCLAKAREQGKKGRQRGRKKKPAEQSDSDDGKKAVRKKVHALSDLLDELETVNFSVVNSTRPDDRDEVYATVNLRGTPATLRVKVDTGAQGNILPMRTYNQMFPVRKPALTPTRTILTAYDGSRIQHHGCVTLPCEYDGHTTDAKFYVAEAAGPVILGLPSSRNLHLVTLHCAVGASEPALSTPAINTTEDLKRAYPGQFDRIGNFPGQYHIVLSENAQPVIHAPRRCPVHLREELKEELESMEKEGVITKVAEPTDWVSSIVVAKRSNGKLRVCLDPKDLNKSIKRCHHQPPTAEEITHKLAGAKFFSKMDAKNGYWSVKLDEESSLLTTFNTPFGRYRYLRMPFGLVMSQDVFQQKMDQILESCEGVIGIADDVVIYGSTEQEHDDHMHRLMRVSASNGLVYNSAKCFVKEPRITFFGTIYDHEGKHPDPAKVDAIHQMSAPNDKHQLQVFLGMVTYMSPFIQDLSAQTADLRELLKKDTEFVWSPSHQAAFDKLKGMICKETTLSHFDSTKKSVIQVDASQKGIGAALLQDGKPVAFASKSLSDAETRYANIERELLAVVFGCERFHTYVYGNKFQVDSDHKPLEMITRKPLKLAPPRLQRMLLRLQPYDVEVLYRPGREVALADALSRDPAREQQHIHLDLQVNFVQFSQEKLSLIQDESAKDPTLSELREVITVGWPNKARELPQSLQPYWSFRDELSVEDGLILKGERILIPPKVQRYILDRLHDGHQGSEKTKLRAKDCVFWLTINSDIDKYTKECSSCQEHRRSQTREPLIQHEVPSRPWQVLGTDLFHFNGENHLIVADYYSKFFVVRKVPTPCTSTAVVNLLAELFAEHGIPEKVVSDNGPQYDCEKFRTFSHTWGFNHTTSSPRYPQSNGFIERTIQTVKNTLKKAKADGKDLNMALLCVRATPLDTDIPSPAELLYGRKIRGPLPIRIRNTISTKDRLRELLLERQQKQKHYADAHAHDLPPLAVGQKVRVQDQATHLWAPATVEQVGPEPRSYVVRTPSGAALRRNRRQLAAAPERAAAEGAQPSESKKEQAVTPSPAATPAAKTITRSGRTVRPPRRFRCD